MVNQATTQFYTTNQLDGLSALDVHTYQQSFPKHSHDTYQVTLTKQGVFKNQLGENLVHAFKNQISITHPKEVHATICDEKTGHSFFTLYLPPTLFESSFKLLKHKKTTEKMTFKSMIDDPQLVVLIKQLQHVLTQQKNKVEPITWLIIERLLNHRQVTTTEHNNPLTVFDLSQLNTQNIKFSLDNWAQQFDLDRFKFLRLFKSQTGMTPNQYLIFQRIKQSQLLLIKGSDLTETALECGFYDLPHFHKNFKKLIGVTPAVYQQAHII